jgi:hypothetical protein
MLEKEELPIVFATLAIYIQTSAHTTRLQLLRGREGARACGAPPSALVHRFSRRPDHPRCGVLDAEAAAEAVDRCAI